MRSGRFCRQKIELAIEKWDKQHCPFLLPKSRVLALLMLTWSWLELALDHTLHNQRLYMSYKVSTMFVAPSFRKRHIFRVSVA
jgi:hypothetical protein